MDHSQIHSGGGLNAFFFTDLLLSEFDAYHKVGGSGEFNPIPSDAIDDAKTLFAICNETSKSDCCIEYKSVKYRCSRIMTVTGVVFALRRPMSETPKLAKLGYHPALTKRLTSKSQAPIGIQNGIVIFCGVTCSGKTTSAGSLLAERLTQHGGLAVTLEDPPELPLQGVYGVDGHGRCYQCAGISENGGIAAMGASVLRFGSPNIVLYGEIRDGKSAAEAIRSGLSGHLILLTIHGSGIKEAIERMIGYATETIGPAASLQLATALTCVIHQRLEGTGDDRLQLYAESLFVDDGIRSKIREQQLRALDDDITQQKNLMLLTRR